LVNVYADGSITLIDQEKVITD